MVEGLTALFTEYTTSGVQPMLARRVSVRKAEGLAVDALDRGDQRIGERRTPGALRILLLASILGAIVLGIGGRVLMRIIALVGGSVGGFSIEGSLEVVATGALFGAAGGLVLLILDRAHLVRWRALILTASLVLLVGLSSDAARGAASSIALPGRWLALAAFVGLLLLFSTLLLRLAGSPSGAESS